MKATWKGGFVKTHLAMSKVHAFLFERGNLTTTPSGNWNLLLIDFKCLNSKSQGSERAWKGIEDEEFFEEDEGFEDDGGFWHYNLEIFIGRLTTWWQASF